MMHQKETSRKGSLSILFFALTLIGVLLFTFTTSARAQEVTAAITGTVTDPSGAAIPGAQVTATDVLRGTIWPTQTNGAGIYNMPRLPAGRYTLKVVYTGFETVVQPAFELQMNQIYRLDFKLVVGEFTQTVNVTSAPTLLQTDTMQVGLVTSGN